MQNEKKEDRRTRYSKRVIRESLYELMEEKPLSKITVKEICDKADVNRSTFYAYYKDIYDLHQSILKEFFRTQHDIIRHTDEVLNDKKDITDLGIGDFYEIFLYYLRTVESERTLYKFIFNQNSSQSVFVSFRKVFYTSVKKQLPEDTPEKIAQALKRSFAFVNGGTTAILTDWLKSDCAEETPERLAKQLSYYAYGVFNGYHHFRR